jgi:methionyl-tRNA formyltransferase
MTGLRITILTGTGPEHLYVANLLAEALPVDAIIAVDDSARRRPRFRQLGLRRFADKVLLRLLNMAQRQNQVRDVALKDVLGPDKASKFLRDNLVKRMDGFDAARVTAVIAEVKPDILAVYGTRKIPDTILELAPLALNMHTGVSPYYRGTACAFWPLHNNDPANLGATVHSCTSVLDGGAIFAVRRLSLDRSDTLDTVFAKAVAVGAVVYVEVLKKALAGELTGEPQNLGLGREYRASMRGFAAEMRARRNLRRLRAAAPARSRAS